MDIEKLGLGRLGSLTSKSPQHSGNLNVFITYSLTWTLDYCIKIDKEGELFYTSEQEAWLSNFTRNLLQVGGLYAVSIRGESHSGHFLHTLSTATLRPHSALPSLWVSPGKFFSTPISLRHWGP